MSGYLVMAWAKMALAAVAVFRIRHWTNRAKRAEAALARIERTIAACDAALAEAIIV